MRTTTVVAPLLGSAAMRLLAACSLGGAGHLHPLLPFLAAAEQAGRRNPRDRAAGAAGMVELAGYPFRAGGEPAEEVVAPMRDRLPFLPAREASLVGNRDLFGRLATEAMLPGMERTCTGGRLTSCCVTRVSTSSAITPVDAASRRPRSPSRWRTPRRGRSPQPRRARRASNRPRRRTAGLAVPDPLSGVPRSVALPDDRPLQGSRDGSRRSAAGLVGRGRRAAGLPHLRDGPGSLSHRRRCLPDGHRRDGGPGRSRAAHGGAPTRPFEPRADPAPTSTSRRGSNRPASSTKPMSWCATADRGRRSAHSRPACPWWSSRCSPTSSRRSTDRRPGAGVVVEAQESTTAPLRSVIGEADAPRITAGTASVLAASSYRRSARRIAV